MNTKNHLGCSKKSASFLEQKDNIKSLFENGITDSSDDKELSLLISLHGYYRLKGYIKPFLRRKNINNFCYIDFKIIRHVIDIDLLLKECLLKYILKIENNISLKISEKLCKDKSPYWYLDDDTFLSSTLSGQDSENRRWKIIAKIKSDTSAENGQHPHPGVVSYANKHGNNCVPSWIVRECISFGTWAQIFDAMTNSHRVDICKLFRFKKQSASKKFEIQPNAFSSWIRSIVILRNTCAHNGLLVNKIFSHHPGQVSDIKSLEQKSGPNILPRIKVIEFILSNISEELSDNFINEVKSIIYKNESSGVDEKIIYKIFGFKKIELDE